MNETELAVRADERLALIYDLLDGAAGLVAALGRARDADDLRRVADVVADCRDVLAAPAGADEAAEEFAGF